MTDIVTSQTPPILHGPSDKEKKYDRQLRLWAASGQAALESANILLVNSGAGAVGVETLKNLVLPGIGGFAIADDALVTEADLDVNFFIDSSCLGQLRSESCTKLLQEMNTEVNGEWFPKEKGPLDLSAILSGPSHYTMVMFTHPIKEEDLATLEEYGRQNQVPIIEIHSSGFYAYFQVRLHGTFPIVDTHPDVEKTTDLRLLQPWDELTEFARDMTNDIDTISDHQHGHLPYVVLLLHFLEKWRESHDGNNPTKSDDKKAFRKLVLNSARTSIPGGEENFIEAEAAINKNVVLPRLEDGVKEIFDHPISNENERTSGFWAIAKAIKSFYAQHGCLPLPGGLPDMKAESKVYVRLQGIYKAKARKDAEEVLKLAQEASGGEDIDAAEVEMFCKNARFVKLINAVQFHGDMKSLFESEEQKDAEADAMSEATGGAFQLPKSQIFIYLALKAISQKPDSTADEIIAFVSRDIPKAADNKRLREAVEEALRTSGGELHNISACVGGMVAQEVIKIITKQYIPIDNTCIYDGISCRCQVLRL